MEVKINKEIRNYTESMFFGLSLRQFIFSVLACGVAVGLYFLLRPQFGTETLSWVCILGAFPFAAMGFIKYNGMTAEQFVWAWIKSEFLMPKKLMFLCGSSMYTNKHAWTNKDGTYKEVYYYICGRNKQERGHHCDYKASLRKTDIEPLVIEAVKELVSDKYFAKEIEKRIGVQTDTTAIDKELANYESKLKEVDLNKARLEREIDNLPIDARFRERKIHDMTLRLDALYDTIVELEERIEDAKLRKSSIEMETITLDNIYKLMLNFGKLYDIISDEEKKSLITYLIKEIQIYPNGESEQPLKSIEFNFPIYRDGQEVRRLLWEKGNTVETVVLLNNKNSKKKDYVEIGLDTEDYYKIKADKK